ncbi:hypothetical protein P389DRAFT_172616 [Cystobasidium minutum MCA 4210]|uniref:uncharacterized protein n=1 Tax=Cystobasidium minutum MCA 4210 TaxID=1397322 RepID=UPI0034CE882A|eukprot:jgi/Rhomi1/172616/fgenesh1_kg.5_\
MGFHWVHRTKTPTTPAEAEPDKEELPQEAQNAAQTLQHVVGASQKPGVPSKAGILAQADRMVRSKAHSWLSELLPELEEKTAEEDLGNFVVINRSTGERAWESVPLYVRVGMSLLFTGAGDQLLGYKYISKLLIQQSIRQGKLFDSEDGAYEHIVEFVKTYNLEGSLGDLLEPDLTKYKTFNNFFSRQLKPDARPAEGGDDIVVSLADCRLTVWENVTDATQFWIKGRQFTIPNLLQDESISGRPEFKEGCSLAIFRLAPQDYHRWHSPLQGTIGAIKAIPGQLYTVNPMAVRNKDVDVFTANKRDIRLITTPTLESGKDAIEVPIVSVGAMLVGSIGHTRPEGAQIARAEELGYFAYGGSTVIAVFPQGFVKFNDDLVNYSKDGLETAAKVGEKIGVRLQ